MAEINVTRTRLAQIAGVKAPAAAHNRVRMAVITMPTTYAAPAQNDTAGTEIVLFKGARLVNTVFLSNAAGTASSTLSVGLRNPVTKVAIDATAIVNAAGIASASNGPISTGTKMLNGQDYILLEDAEIYLTFGGAAGAANQQIRVEIPYVAP